MSSERQLGPAASAEHAPSRSALELAERESDARGHELDGFLSRSAGFMPRWGTVPAFPPRHGAWDEIAHRMPELWRTVSVRPALEAMPVLAAGPEDLADEYVWRAACALGVFAHSYVRVERLASAELPPAVAIPWAAVTARLGRREPYLSYDDLIVYNHRLRNPSRGHVVENMELLVPTVDNAEERVFYLGQVEILARATPLVGAVVRAQEAAVRADDDALQRELLAMVQTWQEIVELSLRKVDPNPLSATYVDQVVWANTVAPLAVPIREGTVGPAGAASAAFHLMDAFLGRSAYQSKLGQDVAELREHMPPNQLRFIRAVERFSVRDHIARTGDRRLQGVFDALLDAYAGPKGYLGSHRLKVYGFLELAFKVGRSVTITHIEGSFRDRQWKTVDSFLEESRGERHAQAPSHSQQARIVAREATSSARTVQRIILDASQTGAVYRAGDRCGVLAMNRPAAVEATLRALRATGEEPIALNQRWRHAVRRRSQHPSGTRVLPLRSFLAYARLRPLTRQMAKDLLAISASRCLHDVVEGHLEEQWELADVLQALRREGYDVTRLVSAGLEQREALARIVPPEDFRMYSVASAPDAGVGGVSSALELTVAQLRYAADLGAAAGGGDPAGRGDPPGRGDPAGGGDSAGRPDDDVSGERLGTASTYLDEGAGGETFPIQLVRPSRFALPRDPSRPIVMFAGGVGIAPFRGFIAQRSRDPASGQNWLFYATRTSEHFYCGDELAAAVEQGRLSLRVAFSREDAALAGSAGRMLRSDGPRGRIDEAIARDPDVQAALWEMLRPASDGGREGFFYVCGRAGFAQSVMSALTAVAERFLGDPLQARIVLRRLLAAGRYMQDVFTSWTPHAAPGVLGAGVYDASEVALHMTREAGQWLTIGGEVYDLTEFLHLHPGGPRILTENLGLDATREYEAVLHHENSEIDAMLAMYKIGSIRRLRFGDEWGIALVPKLGLARVSLHDLYRSWVRFMHLLTEFANALENDWGYMTTAVTRADEAPDELNALKVQFASNTHQRFLLSYYEAALGEDILNLWAVTRGLCAPPEFARSLHAAITAAQTTPAAQTVQRVSQEMKTLYRQVEGNFDTVPAARWRSLRDVLGLVERLDRAFLARMREVIRTGVIVFEQLESRTRAEGGDRLIAALDEVPPLVRHWHEEFVAGLAEIGWPATLGA